jgi:hypothetical protein
MSHEDSDKWEIVSKFSIELPGTVQHENEDLWHLYVSRMTTYMPHEYRVLQ